MAMTASRPGLFHEDRGTGDPLLVLTGFSISSAVFDPIAGLYARHFRCLTFDYRGTARSERWNGLPSMALLAADGVRLLDELEVPSAHVYGISMGGMVAQELAIRFPHRVRGLVLAGTTPGGPLGARPALRDAAGLAYRIGAASRAGRRPSIAPALFSPRFLAEQPERAAELQRYFERHRSRTVTSAGQFLGTVYHDRARHLARIEAPTLVLHGEHDAMSPLRNARMLAAGIPDAELRIIPGTGHAFPLEAPERSLEALLDWLARRPDIAAGTAPSRAAWAIERAGRPFALLGGMLRTGGSAAVALSARGRGRSRGTRGG